MEDSKIVEERIQYQRNDVQVHGLLFSPEMNIPMPAIILIHEVFGLVTHIKDVAKRLSSEGYIVLAVDLYWRDEVPVKTFSNRNEMRQFMKSLDYEKMTEELKSGVGYLMSLSRYNGSVSSIGFCMGGALSLGVALKEKKLKSSVIYYGRIESYKKQLQDLDVPLLAFYGDRDEIVNQTGGFIEELEKWNKDVELHIYEGVGHGFFNDTRKNYDKEAADDSWRKMLHFLRK